MINSWKQVLSPDHQCTHAHCLEQNTKLQKIGNVRVRRCLQWDVLGWPPLAEGVPRLMRCVCFAVQSLLPHTLPQPSSFWGNLKVLEMTIKVELRRFWISLVRTLPLWDLTLTKKIQLDRAQLLHSCTWLSCTLGLSHLRLCRQ
jgi:hypothetical protein